MSWQYENYSKAQRMERWLFPNLSPQPNDTITPSFVNVMRATDGTVKIDNVEPGEKMSVRKVYDTTFLVHSALFSSKINCV